MNTHSFWFLFGCCRWRQFSMKTFASERGWPRETTKGDSELVSVLSFPGPTFARCHLRKSSVPWWETIEVLSLGTLPSVLALCRFPRSCGKRWFLKFWWRLMAAFFVSLERVSFSTRQKGVMFLSSVSSISSMRRVCSHLAWRFWFTAWAFHSRFQLEPSSTSGSLCELYHGDLLRLWIFSLLHPPPPILLFYFHFCSMVVKSNWHTVHQ